MADLEALARQLAACEQFRRMPGVRPWIHVAPTCEWIRDDETGLRLCRDPRYPLPPHASYLPDLTDPATLGILESMVEDVQEISRGRDDLWRLYIWLHDPWRHAQKKLVTKGKTKGIVLARTLLRQWRSGEVDRG